MTISSRETFLDLGKNLVSRDRPYSARAQIRESALSNPGPRFINFSVRRIEGAKQGIHDNDTFFHRQGGGLSNYVFSSMHKFSQ